MRTYETVFVLKPNLSADDQTKHIEFYKENITKHGGEIVNVDVWGKQQLAYPIENFTEGFYVVIQFKAEHEYANGELEKRFKFNEDVLRYVVVMLDEKKFKIKPRKESVRRERPISDRADKPKVDGEGDEPEGDDIDAEEDSEGLDEEK